MILIVSICCKGYNSKCLMLVMWNFVWRLIWCIEDCLKVVDIMYNVFYLVYSVI